MPHPLEDWTDVTVTFSVLNDTKLSDDDVRKLFRELKAMYESGEL